MKKEKAVKAIMSANASMMATNFLGFSLQNDDRFYRESTQYTEELREALLSVLKSSRTALFLVRTTGTPHVHSKALQFKNDLLAGKYPQFEGMTRREICLEVVRNTRYIRIRPDSSYRGQNPDSPTARVTYEMSGTVNGVTLFLRIRTLEASGQPVQTDLHESEGFCPEKRP